VGLNEQFAGRILDTWWLTSRQSPQFASAQPRSADPPATEFGLVARAVDHREPVRFALYCFLLDQIDVLSWTTDVNVAREFARGHRGIEPDDPVVVRAHIPAPAIFTVLVGRQESEIVLDPGELIDIND
jgi:hypothetical protein